MHETSLSLLGRLQGSPESESWDRLLELYAPLIRGWLRKYDVPECDADDLLQEVLLAVTKDVGKFAHGGQPGAFRGWLKAILVNRLRNYWRSQKRLPEANGTSDLARRLAELEDPASQLSRLWNDEHNQHVLRRLLALVEPQFAANTWTAFCRVALDRAEPRDVAAELNLSLNAIVIAKSRVLNRLRQEAAGLVDTSSSFLVDC